MAYPRLKQPTQRLITAISPSIVNISVALLSQIPTKGFYVIGGSQSLRRGPATYHLGDTQGHSITVDGVFQQVSILYAKCGIYGRTSNFNLMSISRSKNKDCKTLVLRAFQSKCPLLELHCCGRFPCTVIKHPVDTFNLIYNPVRHLVKHLPGKLCGFSSHKIRCTYCP